MRIRPNKHFLARGDWAARPYAQVLILHNADGQRMVCEQTHTALCDPNHDSRLGRPTRPCRSVGLSGNYGCQRAKGNVCVRAQVRGMLGAGRSFGERALLLNEPRAATIQVRAPCK